MISLIGYILLPSIVGLLSATLWLPLLMFLVLHFCVFRPAGMWGWSDDFESDVYYTLVALGFSLVGWAYSYNAGVKSTLFSSPNSEVSGATELVWHRRLIRIFKTLVLFAFIIVAVVIYEVIPYSAIAASTIVVFALVIVTIVMFFVFFRQWPRSAEAVSAVRLWYHAFVYDAIYDFVYTNKGRRVFANKTNEMTMWIGIMLGINSVVFLVVRSASSTFWQFWPALIAFGIHLFVLAVSSVIIFVRSRAVGKSD